MKNTVSNECNELYGISGNKKLYGGGSRKELGEHVTEEQTVVLNSVKANEQDPKQAGETTLERKPQAANNNSE